MKINGTLNKMEKILLKYVSMDVSQYSCYAVKRNQ